MNKMNKYLPFLYSCVDAKFFQLHIPFSAFLQQSNKRLRIPRVQKIYKSVKCFSRCTFCHAQRHLAARRIHTIVQSEHLLEFECGTVQRALKTILCG